MQIIQLVVGTSQTVFNLVIYPEERRACMTTGDIICNIYTFLYLVPLVALFIQFFVKSFIFGAKKSSNKQKKIA